MEEENITFQDRSSYVENVRNKLFLQLDDDIEELHIFDSSIDHVICPKSLKVLWITDGHVKCITLSPDIVFVDVYNCGLQKIIVPQNGLGMLQKIGVANNCLTSFEVTSPCLKQVDISYNQIEHIDVKWPHLNHLNIQGNPGIRLRYLGFMFKDSEEQDMTCYTKGDYLEVLTKGCYKTLGTWNEDALNLLYVKLKNESVEFFDLMIFYDAFMEAYNK